MVPLVLLSEDPWARMMHLDEKREIRISHHVRAIEALSNRQVISLVFLDGGNCMQLALTDEYGPAEKTQLLLALTALCLKIATVEACPEST